MLTVERLARATHFEKLLEGGKGSLVAVRAAYRQAQEEQLRQVRRMKPKTRGAKARKTANAAINCHLNLQLLIKPGRKNAKQREMNFWLIACRLNGTTPYREERTCS
jgi:hypothetical protein